MAQAGWQDDLRPDLRRTGAAPPQLDARAVYSVRNCAALRPRLVTFFGAEHMFGGISGYDAAETSDENPERVATLRALVWAYLRSQLYRADKAWTDAVAALEDGDDPIAKVESKKAFAASTS